VLSFDYDPATGDGALLGMNLAWTFGIVALLLLALFLFLLMRGRRHERTMRETPTRPNGARSGQEPPPAPGVEEELRDDFME
jgi:hypothetical protein